MTAATAPRRMVLAFLIGLLGVATLVGINSCITGEATRSGSVSTGDDRLPVDVTLPSFSISGSLDTALKPGLSLPLDLTLTNPSDRDLSIRDLDVTVAAVDAPNATTRLPCAVSDFSTIPVTGDISLPAGSASSLSELGLHESTWPQVVMLNTSSNQDGCKDATLALDYAATGESR